MSTKILAVVANKHSKALFIFKKKVKYMKTYFNYLIKIQYTMVKEGEDMPKEGS